MGLPAPAWGIQRFENPSWGSHRLSSQPCRPDTFRQTGSEHGPWVFPRVLPPSWRCLAEVLLRLCSGRILTTIGWMVIFRTCRLFVRWSWIPPNRIPSPRKLLTTPTVVLSAGCAPRADTRIFLLLLCPPGLRGKLFWASPSPGRDARRLVFSCAGRRA